MSVICGGINIDFECIYKKVELKHLAELPKSVNGTVDAEEEEDVMYLCEEVYREEFLRFFGVTSFEECIINTRVGELLKLVIVDPKFSEILKIISAKYAIFKEDTELAFMQLFSYQFFYLTYDCIKQLFLPDESTDVTFALLENAVRLFGTE